MTTIQAPQPAPASSQFRKRPVVIEAHQWDGTESGIQRIKAHFPALNTLAKNGHLARDAVTYWRIGTLEGGHEVTPGDWIIKGVKGEFYPCKPEIFAMTYEPAAIPAPEGGPALSDKQIAAIASTHPRRAREPETAWLCRIVRAALAAQPSPAEGDAEPFAYADPNQLAEGVHDTFLVMPASTGRHGDGWRFKTPLYLAANVQPKPKHTAEAEPISKQYLREQVAKQMEGVHKALSASSPAPAQAEALRLADAIDPFTRREAPDHLTSKVAADLLRRLASAQAPAVQDGHSERIEWIPVRGYPRYSSVPERREPLSASSRCVLLCVNGEFAGTGYFTYSVLAGENEGLGEWSIPGSGLLIDDYRSKVTAFAYPPKGPTATSQPPVQGSQP